jgi:hypothetical protein
MEHIPDFRNLYYKPLVLNGEKDKESLLKQADVNGMTLYDVSKWLTAYLWQGVKDIYGWKVFVYPALSNGSFISFTPYFESEKPPSYDNVKKIMAVVESHIMNDT